MLIKYQVLLSDGNNKQDSLVPENEKDKDPSEFLPRVYSKSRGIAISQMVASILLIASLIGHVVVTIFRCIKV